MGPSAAGNAFSKLFTVENEIFQSEKTFIV